MRTIETELYQYDELGDEAKETAREWFSRHVFNESCDWEFVYEDAATCADILGLDLRQRRVTLVGGGHRYEPSIYFSGFWNQGDGANFEGHYHYAKGAAKKIREHAPQEEELHRIADALQDVQRRCFYRLVADCKPRGRYFDMDVEVYDKEERYRDIGTAEEDIRELMNDFAHWIYERLEAEYDYQTSEECIAESIRCNEYEFTEDGEIA